MIFLFTGVTLLNSAPGFAQERHISLGASVSAVTSSYLTVFGDKIKKQTVPMPEVNLTYFFTDSWSLEASGGRYELKMRSENNGTNYGNMIVFPLQLAVQYRQNYGHPPPYWDVASYYIGGGGVSYFITDFKDNPAFNVKNGLGGNANAGFDLFLTQAVSFGMEVKYWIAQSDLEAGGQTGHLNLNSYSIEGGFKFFF
jgi:outer membrane protein W